MKNIYITLFILFIVKVSAQVSDSLQIKTEFPIVIPPSPTVAALMKFDEVPVSNYTGIPDVSIPLYGIGTNSKNVSLSVSLKYHPLQVAVDERSSDVGLGWSLFAGGTISRTVRGMADEIYDTQGYSNGNGKIGIYHSSSFYKNDYYRYMKHLLVASDTYFTDTTINKFFWEAGEKGILDTEHDLWQVSFMGKSASFRIEKNIQTQQLEVKNVDIASALKIVNLYNPTTFEPIAFHVYDENGIKYVFDIVEETTTNSFSTTSYVYFSHASPSSIVGKSYTHKSAFHLSKVYDANNQLLLDFNYSNNSLERTSNTTLSYYDLGLYDSTYSNFFRNNYTGGVDALEVATNQQTINNNVSTRKLVEIVIPGQGKIQFDFVLGREDTNLVFPQTSSVFKGMTIYDKDNVIQRKVILSHEYKTFFHKRLFLNQVAIQNKVSEDVEVYQMEYKDYTGDISGTVAKDRFGYFTMRPDYFTQEGFYYREVDPDACTTEVLQKMKLPTGGSIIFDYEANTYSHIGNELLTNFDANPKNWIKRTRAQSFTTLNNQKSLFFTIADAQDVNFTASYQGQVVSDYRFSIYRFENGNYTLVGGIDHLACEILEDCNLLLKNLVAGTYYVDFTSVDMNFPNTFSSQINAFYKTRSNNNYQFLYGGGIRIKRIGFFEEEVSKTFYDFQDEPFLPKKEVNYNYNNFTSNHSSGSLVMGYPIFEYPSIRASLLERNIGNTEEYSISPSLHITNYTDYNNIKAMKTSGSDVGYKNVKVEETGNGYTRYTYTSPFDTPEQFNDTYPFLPHFNYDYKRGLLIKSETFNNQSKIITEQTNQYEFEEKDSNDLVYGLNLWTNYVVNGSDVVYSNPYGGHFKTSEVYLNNANCNSNRIISFPCDIIKPFLYIQKSVLRSSNGWAKLKNVNTKNYFYLNGSPTPNVVETDESYVYNPLNKKIAERSITKSQEQILTTKYFYHTGNSIHTQNRIAEIERIETYRGSELLSKSKINYNNNWTNNVSYLPQTIQTAKAGESFENRLHYLKYDAYGHPLEVKQEAGMQVCYIWGYHQTQPVAKIENATYTQVEPYVANIQTLSNGNNEQNLITALNNLRAVLPNAMITTFTYKPLIGVSTITDPKGQTTTYEYDSFGRLQRVKDHLGNILSENEYHYRTQN